MNSDTQCIEIPNKSDIERARIKAQQQYEIAILRSKVAPPKFLKAWFEGVAIIGKFVQTINTFMKILTISRVVKLLY